MLNPGIDLLNIMKRLLIIVSFMLYAASTLYAYEHNNILTGNISRKEIRECIVPERSWVPYPAYNDRNGWRKLLGEAREMYIRKGEQYLDNKWNYVKTSSYLAFEKTGDRMVMQNPYEENIEALAYLLRAELAEGKGRFLPDILDGTICFCEMSSWALSAHLFSHSKNHRSIPNVDEPIVAIRQALVSEMLSWVWYFFHEEFDKISPIFSHRLRHELQVRMLDPFLSRDDFWWMGIIKDNKRVLNNWTVTCAYNAMMCFMLLEDDADKLSEGVYKAMQCVDNLLNCAPDDGACVEGPSYWRMNGGMLVNFLSALNLVTGGKVNFLEHPYVKSQAEFYVHSCVGDEWIVNFSDASARYSNVSWPLLFRIGNDVKSPLLMSVGARGVQRDGRVDFENDIRPREQSIFQELEILRNKESMVDFKGTILCPPFVWYPSAQICYMDNGNGMYVAAKGGHNFESHNHNDIGSGVLYIDQTPILVDAGVGVYSRKTFSDERYTLWNNQSQYHNLPSINGVMQMDGIQYHATDVKTDSLHLFFSADIAPAYPKEANVKSWVRSWHLSTDELIIQDKFSISKVVAPSTINFITWGRPSLIKEGEIAIETGTVSAKLLFNEKQFTATVEEIQISDEKLSHVWDDRLFRIVLKTCNQHKTGIYQFRIRKDDNRY